MGKFNIPNEVVYTISNENFCRRNRLFTRERNEIMQCVLFEKPSGLVYPIYFTMPLYMPSNIRYLTYGRRIAEITGYRNSENIDAERLIDALQETVFPFFERIGTPQLLLEYLLTAQDVQHYFFCPPAKIGMLKAYTALYLHNRSLFFSMASETEQLIRNDHCFSETVTGQMGAELKTLTEQAQLPDTELNIFFEKIICSTRAIFK